MSQGGLDQAFLGDLLEGDRDFGVQLLEAFEEASAQWLQLASEACQAWNSSDAVRAFHSMKGSAASVGLRCLRDLSRELEQSALDGDLETCQRRLADLRERVAWGRAALANFLETL